MLLGAVIAVVVFARRKQQSVIIITRHNIGQSLKRLSPLGGVLRMVAFLIANVARRTADEMGDCGVFCD